MQICEQHPKTWCCFTRNKLSAIKISQRFKLVNSLSLLGESKHLHLSELDSDTSYLDSSAERAESNTSKYYIYALNHNFLPWMGQRDERRRLQTQFESAAAGLDLHTSASFGYKVSID